MSRPPVDHDPYPACDPQGCRLTVAFALACWVVLVIVAKAFWPS